MQSSAICLLAFVITHVALLRTGVADALSALAPFAEVPGLAPVPSTGGLAWRLRECQQLTDGFACSQKSQPFPVLQTSS